VEEIVSSLPEDKSQLLVVIGHSLRHRRLLCQVHETVNVLNGLVSLLPQLHLDSRVKLNQTSVLIQLLSLRLGDADIGHLGRQLLDVFKMLTQLVAQLSKLSLAIILQTKCKGLKE
jgi:hypothetical protein